MTEPRQSPSTVVFTLDREIGCQVTLGNLSLTTHCGHAIVQPGADARRCECGQLGHLNAYASETAVVQRAAEALDAGRSSSLSERLAAGDVLNSALVAACAEAGDPLALEIVLETARCLAVGIVNMMHTVDPDCVRLQGPMKFGGRESPLGRRFLACLRDEVRRLTFPLLAEQTVIDFAEAG